MNTRLRIAGGLCLLTLLAGCETPGPYLPEDTTKYTIENTEKFVLLDRASQHSVTCTALQEQVLPDGRLEVVANVKNRERRRIEVQINCPLCGCYFVFYCQILACIISSIVFCSCTFLEKKHTRKEITR